MTAHATPSIPSPTPAVSRRYPAALTTAAVALLLALCVLLGLSPLLTVPRVVPAAAPATTFSAARAMDDLAILAAAPRPVGSPANAAARDYLVRQIRVLGLEAVEQSALVTRHEPGFPETHLMRVHNVMTRVPGTDPTAKALLISGHYDSVATSTGASDCGMCSAVTLETLRAVAAAAAAGDRLRNDVIFLFTDGEEIGVVGARAFMEQHPWAADVGLSVVFEGLGSDSAPLLYISNDESGAVVAEALDAMAGSGARPLASSFLHDFMWAVAGNTGSDLDAFVADTARAGGAPGLGFIYLSLPTVAAYHTTADSAARLDPRSVQGMGDYALAVTRLFGNRPLDDLPRSPNLVTFPLLPGVLARYSYSWALPLAILAAVALLAALALGARRRALTVGGLLVGLAVWLLTALTAVVAVTAVWWFTRWLTPALHNATLGGWYGGPVYLVAALTLALAVTLGWRGLLRRRVRPDNLTGGALLAWALLALLTAAALPGLSYLYVWPLLVAAALWGVHWLRGGNGWRRAARVAPAAVGLWLFAAVFTWLWVYVGRAESLMGLPAAALPVVFGMPLIALIAALLQSDVLRVTSDEFKRSNEPQVTSDEFHAPPVTRHSPPSPLVTRRSSFVTSLTRRPSLVTLLLALALFAFPALFLRPSAARPWANAVAYTLDVGQSEAGDAAWLAFTDSRNGRGARFAADEWTAQFLGDRAEPTTIDPWLVTSIDTPYPALRAPAAAVNLPRTTVSGAAGAGHVRLTVARPAIAWLTQLTLHSAAPITALAVNGRPLDLGGSAPTEYTFKVIGREAEVALNLTTAGPVTVETLDRLVLDLHGIAAQTGIDMAPRPAWMMPAPGSDITDAALVRGSFTIK